MNAKDKKKGASVPRLRFPEFIGKGEWGYAQMSDIYVFKKNNSFSRDMLNYNAGDVKNIHYGDIHTKFSSHFYAENENVPFVNSNINLECISEDNLCSVGDVIFADASEDMKDIGKCIEIISTNEERILSGLHTIFARQRSSVLVVGFASHLFQSPRVRALIQKEAQGTKILGISSGRLAKISINFPFAKGEQQKIADCLSSLDEQIAAEADKLDALKAHKNGLLTQLFPTEGETLPALRFPEFRDAGEWKKVDFGTIAKFLSGGTPSKDISDYWGGDIPWISASSMHNTKIEKSDCNITRLAVSNGARIAKKGTLLLLVRGSMLHKRILLGISEVDVSFNQDVKALVLNAEITELYLMYFLMASESKLLAAVVQTGIGAGKLDTEDLNNFPIMMPSLIEQKRISDCLSSLDELITAQAQKIELLKSHKKGLMQQLFPETEEAKA